MLSLADKEVLRKRLKDLWQFITDAQGDAIIAGLEKFRVEEILAALDTVFRLQETGGKPRLPGFAGILDAIGASQEAQKPAWKRMTRQQSEAEFRAFVEDDAAWNQLLDGTANDPPQTAQARYTWLLRCRERLRGGGPVLEPGKFKNAVE